MDNSQKIFFNWIKSNYYVKKYFDLYNKNNLFSKKKINFFFKKNKNVIFLYFENI